MSALLLAACLAALGSCVEQERVVIRGGLAAIPGAQFNFGDNARVGRARGASLEQAIALSAPLAGERVDAASGEPLRLEDKDGNITLVSRSPRHVLFHLIRTLDKGEDDLLYEQVLSAATKEEYARRGLDAWDAVEFIKANQKSIRALVATMPLGEQTPGLMTLPIGPNKFRLTANPSMSSGLKFKHAEFILERGVCRLLVIR